MCSNFFFKKPFLFFLTEEIDTLIFDNMSMMGGFYFFIFKAHTTPLEYLSYNHFFPSSSSPFLFYRNFFVFQNHVFIS
jgi:hypothetical protein